MDEPAPDYKLTAGCVCVLVVVLIAGISVLEDETDNQVRLHWIVAISAICGTFVVLLCVCANQSGVFRVEDYV